MEILKTALNYYLKACQRATDRTTRKCFYDQAFGACQYHIMMFHNDQEQVEQMWNDYKEHFEEAVYNIAPSYFAKATDL